MDPIVGRDNVFSRGPSPPSSQQPFQVPNDPHVASTSSLRESAPATSTTHLDNLFQGLNAPATSHVSPQPSNSGSTIYSAPQDPTHSGPATPASVHAGSVSSSMSGPSNASVERQNALLSLLGSVPAPPSNAPVAQMSGPLPPQQVPTPPGSATRANVFNESQGKLLLEQLMAGSASKYSYPEPPYQPHPATSRSSPPNMQAISAAEAPSAHDIAPPAPENSYVPQDPQRETADLLGPPAGQPRAPSPARRSMFDFVSPFDALANTSTAGPKRKPPPQQPITQATEEPASWPVLPVDPKRKSVENLMDQLTRGPASQPAPVPSGNLFFDPYAPNEEPTAQIEPAQTRASRPLPPQPSHAPSPPRGSPPKPHTQPRQQRRAGESPVGQSGRDKDTSPMPVQGHRATGSDTRGRPGGPKKNTVSSPQSQTIVFDVSQPIVELQAPEDTVKTTAIALVKVDSTFLPGTTIGATHWVAYAMTRGRIRVISRSSGDRTLLQLPPLFPSTTTVSDMSVYGNRLAGVTSDGGFVVWELPEIITDDVPGRIMLLVQPSPQDSLHAVKWHPQDPDCVAVASDSNVYLINIEDAAHAFNGEPIPQSELQRVAQIYTVPSPIVGIDFDIPRSALATISKDSTIMMWNFHEKLPFWSNRIRGDDPPSSITFVENGVVIGRKNGTIFQLLPVMGRHVLSTLEFVNGVQDDPEMFGHVNYDARIQTLWVANNRRESLIAVRINFDMSAPSPNGESRGAYFDQVLEFSGPKPTIHFVILDGDADPTGKEAHAACVAAKLQPCELALVAFSVHSSGVDQVLIRREWFESALVSASSRFPTYAPLSSFPSLEPKLQRLPFPPAPAPSNFSQSVLQPVVTVPPPRLKTPPSEEVEAEQSRDENGRVQDAKGKGPKGKNVNWKEKERDENAKEKGRVADGAIITESPLGVALSKEIRKVEENLHTRIGRLINKELDKQHQRLEEARANEQAADFVRQEKILKLISNELTKNTTRVVEMAVKSEVQTSVLPSLENITKTEVKAALGNQISKGLSDSMKQNLPSEIERLLLRPEISSQIARSVTGAVTPVIERQVKDAITKTLIPAYAQQSSTMHQELSRDIHNEIINLKKEVISWQTEALHGQEVLIRELEQAVRLLSDQVKFLTLNASAVPSSVQGGPNRNSPVASGGGQHSQGGLPQLLRQQSMPMTQPAYNSQPHAQFQQQQPPQPSPMHGSWFTSTIAAPQASHPAAPPPIPQQILRNSPPVQSEEWDDTYLNVLSSQDIRQLRELLARSNPDVVMPLQGSSPLSQAVVLTLVHRLSTIIGETSPLDESFKASAWWLQRAATALNTSDPLISPYIARVLPSVQQMLNTTKQRWNILPGSPMDATRAISDVQDILSRKPV